MGTGQVLLEGAVGKGKHVWAPLDEQAGAELDGAHQAFCPVQSLFAREQTCQGFLLVWYRNVGQQCRRVRRKL